MIKKVKGLELMIFVFHNPFEHIWLKSVFDFEYYGIENVALPKVIHI
jgi:hypothetical protein